MSYEQIEGKLAEFEGHAVSVVLPIRGTIVQAFYGSLAIKHDWANHIILYKLSFYPDAELSFQAHDVDKILENPNDQVTASIILKADAWMEQSKLSHA